MMFSPIERRTWETTPRYRMAEWAEAYRIVNKGPSRGQWSGKTMPILDGLMNAFHEKAVEEIVVVGPRQAGKTEASIVNPILYFALFQGRDVLVLYPSASLAQSKWRDSISPAIQASPALRALQMPKHSMGSLDSGRQFRNGATLYMIGADSESAGTSRSVEIVLVDELDMIARPKTGQNDPVDMAIGRSDAYPMTRKIGYTCTVTEADNRIWQAFLAGDQRRPWVPCPRCGQSVVLWWDPVVIDGEPRGGLTYDNTSDARAKKSARWVCYLCGGDVIDADRAEIYRAYQWRPDKPDVTGRASFWYNSLYCPWWPFGKLAALELKAGDDPDKQRDVQIHRKVIPWVNPAIEVEEVSADAIRAHIAGYPRDEIPAEADLVVCTADVHRRLIYWVAVAFRKSDQTAWLIHEDVVEVWAPESLERGIQEPEQRAQLSALRDWYQRIKPGWKQTPYDKPMPYAAAGVDYQYGSDAVSRFVREAGQAKHFAIQGYSSSKRTRWKAPREKEGAKADEIRRPHAYSTMLADGTRLLHSDADWAKRAVHKALSIPPGAPGALYLYPDVSHAFIKHIQAERWVDDPQGGHFDVVRRDNSHFLDCMGMAYVLADLAGVSQLGPGIPAKARRPMAETIQRMGQRKIRTRY